jgi:hypothetical protein
MADYDAEIKTSTILLVLFCTAFAVIVCLGQRHGTPTPRPSHTITEDDPSWDCRTMGNRSCGPSK